MSISFGSYFGPKLEDRKKFSRDSRVENHTIVQLCNLPLKTIENG